MSLGQVQYKFSLEGPVCPHCSAKWVTDEASYFNESGYKLHCDTCNAEFHVQPVAEWSFTCRPVPKKEEVCLPESLTSSLVRRALVKLQPC